MLQPKRTKYRKQSTRAATTAWRWCGNAVSFGEYGLKATAHGQLTARQIEAARRSISRYVKRGGKMWIRVFPDKPITKKPIEVRMGSGKGNVEYWVAQIQPGRMIYEIEGVDEDDRARGVPPGRGQALGQHHFRDPDGALMELKELRQKSADELKAHLVDLQKEQFALRMQKATGQLAPRPTKPAACVARSLASTRCSARQK